MTKLEFLQLFFQNKGYGSKAAIQSIIAIQLDDAESAGAFKQIPWSVYVEDGKFHSVIDGNVVDIEGDVELPFAHMDDRYNLPGDFHPILQGKEITTTFGLLLFNVVLFWEPFGNKVSYVNKSFTKGLIEGIIDNLMVDNPKEGETVPEGKASVSDCLKFTENCYFLEGLGTHFVKPGGVDTLTVDPSVLKRKAELLEQHKDRLSDPVVLTSIIEELVEMDRKIQLSGPSRNFFINDKFISTARKRMFIAFGIEENATGDGWVPLTNSLNDGIDHKELVTYINTAVGGAYSRSMATGEGGSQVKETLRLIGRVARTEEDCGTKKAEPKVLDATEAGYWVGAYYVTEKGPEMITKENVKSLVGKLIYIRAPEFCTTADGNYCHVCLGESLGKLATRLTADVVRVPTEMMLNRMKAHHQAGGKTVKLDLKIAIK